MFGFQRVGDLCWAAGDLHARGFLVGGTAGRTTLNGEGLQHQDGHSHIMANTIPNCVTYDPTYAYELAVIIQDGMRRMYQEDESVFYYITTMNENYVQPDMPKGCEEGIIKGMYLLEDGDGKAYKVSARDKLRVRLLGSGTILREVRAAAEILRKEYKVTVDVWSTPSFNELTRNGQAVERWNMLHPEAEPQVSYVEECLSKQEGPVVIATDYMKLYGEQIRAFVPAPLKVLGTDGFGRSDGRQKLRHFFEVDRNFIVLAALNELAKEGKLERATVSKAIKTMKLDPEKINPVLL